MSAGNGWLPIETAPKDGTFVLIAAHDNGMPSQPMHVLIAQFCEESGEWMRNADEEYSETWPPTHWQPLPDAPSPPSDAKDKAETTKEPT
jgi:hypothetical protein